MLTGIHPLLSGPLLAQLDAMGHSDAVVLADAHFPAARVASRLLDLPGTTTPDVLAAVRTVLPLDDAPSVDLMAAADRRAPAGAGRARRGGRRRRAGVRLLSRLDFYDEAGAAFLVVRTGETRPYGNVILRKGVVDRAGPMTAPAAPPVTHAAARGQGRRARASPACRRWTTCTSTCGAARCWRSSARTAPASRP